MTRLVEHALELRALAQSALGYCSDEYDIERFRRTRELADEILADATGLSEQALAQVFAGERGQATPKLSVRAVVLDGPRSSLLLVRERDDGSWALPGGWADVGATAATVAERETLEEAGLTVRARKLLALLDKRRGPQSSWAHHIYVAYFECEWLAGEPAPGDETDAARFFELDELPDLGFRSPADQVERVIAVARDGLAAAFD